MKKSVWLILGIVLAVLMLVVVIVSCAMGGCTSMIECTSGQIPMKCHWTYTAMRFVACAGIITALISAFASTCEGRRVAAVATALIAIVAIIIVSPAGIGTCSHADSLCNQTALFVYVFSALSIVLSLVMAVKADPEEASKPKMTL